MTTRMSRLALTICVAFGAPLLVRLEAQTLHMRAQVSENLHRYQPKFLVKGAVEIPCTDTLMDVGGAWNKAFRNFQPEARLNFLPKQTLDAVQTLLNGTRPLILITRELSSSEMKAFQVKFQYVPLRIPVCLDANIVFVNRLNPIEAISMQQLDAIYSRNRLGGAPAPAMVWGDLGVKGDLAKRQINAYSRAAGTSARSTFASQALLGGEFRDGIIDREDPSDLAEAISTDPAGIAFGPMAAWYTTNKTLPVVPYQSTEACPPTQDMVTSSRYPMPRIFYAYLNRNPAKPVDPAILESLHFMLAQEGQSAVADLGLLPGPVEFIGSAMKRLDN